MPWFMQMLGFGLVLLGAAVAIWVSFWVLLFLFGLGALFVLWNYLRAFLVAKGILNPVPGIAPEAPEQHTAHITIVEGEFERIEEPAAKQD